MKNIDFGFVADIYDAYVTTQLDIPFYLSLFSCVFFGIAFLK